jgi:hypothetical protein
MLALDEIINGFLSEQDLPNSQFDRIQSIAIRGYRQLHYHSIGRPKQCELDVLPNKTSVLPCDLTNLLDIGVLNFKGELVSLTYDDKLGLYDSTNPQRTAQPIAPVILTNEDYLYTSPIANIDYPFFFMRQYGTGSSSDLGFYKIDWKERVIIYNFGFNYSEVTLSYLPIAGDDGVYYVDPLFQEALIGFITWRHMVGSRKYTTNDREEAKAYYDNQLRIARRAQSPLNPSEIYNQFNRSTRLAPRS